MKFHYPLPSDGDAPCISRRTHSGLIPILRETRNESKVDNNYGINWGDEFKAICKCKNLSNWGACYAMLDSLNISQHKEEHNMGYMGVSKNSGIPK